MWQASALELELPEFPYGSVWLVVAGDSDPRHLSPLAMHALGTADPMIHDLAVPQELLDLRPALLGDWTGHPSGSGRRQPLSEGCRLLDFRCPASPARHV
jgi:siroheme synthase